MKKLSDGHAVMTRLRGSGLAPRKSLASICLLGAVMVLSGSAHAIVKTWDGGGSTNNLSDGINWADDVAPVDGDSLIFAGTTKLTPINDYAANTQFNGISFDNTAGAFVLTGNPIKLGGDLTNNQPSGVETLAVPLVLQQDTAIPVVSGGNLTIAFSTATATSTITTGSVTGVTIGNVGNGYTTAPTVTFAAPTSGTTATGTATVVNGSVTGVTITNAGSGYTAAPAVTFATPGNSISGSFGLTKTGTGTLVLGSSNTYSGATGTVIAGGTIVVGNITINAPAGSSLGTGPITFQGGTLTNGVTANSQPGFAQNMVVPTGQTGIINSNGRIVFNAPGLLTGGGTLTINSSTTVNRLDLKQNWNQFTGRVIINGTTAVSTGVRIFANGGSFTGIAAGTLELQGTAQIQPQNNTPGNTYSFGALVGASTTSLGGSNTAGAAIYSIGSLAGDNTFAGTVSGIAAITKVGDSSTFTLSSPNTYTGATTVNGGTLKITTPTSLGQGTTAGTTTVGGGFVTGVVITNGGTGYTTAPTITFSAAPSGGTTAAGTATFDAVSGAVTGINITNAGRGYTTAPTITFTGGGGSGATAATTTLGGGILDLNGQSVTSEIITLSGGTLTNNGGAVTVGGGVNAVTVSAGGTGYTTATVAFSAPVSGTTATGTAVLAAGVVTGVTITNPGSGYTTAPTVTITGPGTAATATATISTYTVTTSSSAISGTGDILLSSSGSGAGTLTKTGSNTATLAGTVTVANLQEQAGTLALGASNLIADTSNLTVNGGTFSTVGNSETLAQLNVLTTSSLDLGNGASTLTFSALGATGTGTVNVLNYTANTDHLFIGTSATLTGTQLSQIKFIVGGSTLDASQLSSGEVVPIIVTGPTTGGIISEYRLSGPSGTSDEFIEVFNKTGSSLNLTGWSVVVGGVTVATIPSGKVIPARGHLLLTGSAYSLTTYSGAGDVTYATDNIDGASIVLRNASGTTVDQVSSAGLPAPLATTDNYSYVRRMDTGLPQDTDTDTSDFNLVDVQSAVGPDNTTGVSSGIRRLGAPGPENLSSPVVNNGLFAVTIPANAVTRSGVGNDGNLTVRRTFTNPAGSGRTVTSLRLRVVGLTAGTLTSSTAPADVRLVSSTSSDGINLPLLLQEPPAQPNFGGLNASVNLATLPGGSLAPGASVTVELNFKIFKPGTYRFLLNVEPVTTP